MRKKKCEFEELWFQSICFIEWINEKLLKVRVWWGRVVGTDLILDVETEKFIYREMVHDGGIPFQQFQEAKKKGFVPDE